MRGLLLTTIIVVLFASCKKEEDVTPNSNQSNSNSTEVKANDDAVTTQYNNAITISVLGNDTGVDISLSSIVSEPSNGTVSISGNSVVYTPDNGYEGDDTFTYTISDLSGTSSTATVTVTVLPNNVTNNAPTFTKTSLRINHEGNWIKFTDFLSDSDGDKISIISITGAVNGTIQTTRNMPFELNSNPSNEAFTYIPNNTIYAGVENLVVTVSDGTETVTANVELTYGFAGQIATYNLIEKYLDVQFSISSQVPALKFNTDGTVTSNQDGAFWNSSATSGTFTISSTGKFRLDPYDNGVYIDYTVTELNSGGIVGLTFTDGSEVQHVWVD